MQDLSPIGVEMTDLLSESTVRPQGRLVALPDTRASHNDALHRTPYRIGIESDEPGAQYVLGAPGPGGQNLPWIYATAGSAIRYEINLQENRLTVVYSNPSTGETKAVHYPISSNEMLGEAIEVGAPISVVFAFDEDLFSDETPEIDSWCATSGARYYDELVSHVGRVSQAVDEFHAALEVAASHNHVRRATAPPPSAQPFEDIVGERDLTNPEVIAIDGVEPHELEIDLALPEGVQIVDPATGKTFVGRRWVKPHETTTVNALVAGGYRLAVLRFANDDVATLLPNFSAKKLGIQIKTRRGIIGRVLNESAAAEQIGPGLRLTGEIERALDGNPAPAGQQFTSPPIVVVVGVGPEVEHDVTVDLPHDTTLAEFRNALRHEAVSPEFQGQETTASLVAPAQPEMHRQPRRSAPRRENDDRSRQSRGYSAPRRSDGRNGGNGSDGRPGPHRILN